jgi:hypothetical protein
MTDRLAEHIAKSSKRRLPKFTTEFVHTNCDGIFRVIGEFSEPLEPFRTLVMRCRKCKGIVFSSNPDEYYYDFIVTDDQAR